MAAVDRMEQEEPISFETHKVIRTHVIELDGGYGVGFTFDDGHREVAATGENKATAEFYAREQIGEVFPLGLNPLLLNAEKANKLRAG